MKKGQRVSESTRKKMQAAARRRWSDPAYRRKIEQANKGQRAHTEEQLRAISERNRSRIGKKALAFKGGRRISSQGYVQVLIDGTGRYEYEHRVVAAMKIGRPLSTNEVVHHIDGDKTNNAPENLQVFSSNAEHLRHHRENGDW